MLISRQIDSRHHAEQEWIDLNGRDPDFARQVHIGLEEELFGIEIRIPVILNLVIEFHLGRGTHTGGI